MHLTFPIKDKISGVATFMYANTLSTPQKTVLGQRCLKEVVSLKEQYRRGRAPCS